MNEPIVVTSRYVTLVGGGEATPEDLSLALAASDTLVAADGGAALALAAGHLPDAVIGDFDSLDEAVAQRIPARRLHRIAEQDSTDFDKALRNISAPLVLAVGFLGARVDHQLAVFHTLVRRADRPCLLIGPTELVFVAPPHTALDLAPGDVVSLFPLAQVSGRSTGLVWSIDGLRLAPDQKIGTSNRAQGPVTLDVDAPGLLVIVPRRALPQVMAALAPLSPDQAGPPRWPARA